MGGGGDVGGGLRVLENNRVTMFTSLCQHLPSLDHEETHLSWSVGWVVMV